MFTVTAEEELKWIVDKDLEKTVKKFFLHPSGKTSSLTENRYTKHCSSRWDINFSLSSLTLLAEPLDNYPSRTR